MRDEPPLALPPAEGAADAAEAASLWARRLGRSMGLAPAAGYRELRIHADGAEARSAALELIAGATRTIDVCTFILSTDGLGDEIAQALRSQAERGVKVRLLIDGIGAWLGGRLDMQALKRSGVEVGQVRAAVPIDPARPRQPAQPPQDDRRRRRADVVRRPQLRRRVLRGRSGQARRHELAQPRLARPQLRPARRARRPRLRAVREGLGLCGPRAGRPALPRAGTGRGERGTAGAAGAERAGAGRRHGAVAAGLGLLHGAAPGPGGHALLHSRRDAADGAHAGGAPRRADRHRPAAPLQPSPRRRRPAPAAARPRHRRRTDLVRALHAACQGGGRRRPAGPGRLGQPRPAQPLPQLRADGRLLRARRRAPLRRLDRARAGSSPPASSRRSRAWCATCSEGLLLWLAFQL